MKDYDDKEYKHSEDGKNVCHKAITREVRNEKGIVTDIYVEGIETYRNGILAKKNRETE